MTDIDESLRTILARSGTAPDYTMGVLQNETGIAAETLRSWENRYGYPTPARTPGNHRLYSERDIATVRWLLEQTRRGQAIRTAIAILKRHLPVDESGPENATADAPSSPLDRLIIALQQDDLAAAQPHWDDLALGLSPSAMGEALLRAHLSADFPDRANAFLLRKATVLLDAAGPDTGETPVAIISSGQSDVELPATIAAAAFARAGNRVLIPMPAITSLAGIGAVREFGAQHVLLIDIADKDADTLSALLPDITLRHWDPETGIPADMVKSSR